jgi:hypothetical protein
MTKITGFAQLAVRAADLADRCEAAGALVAAALLRSPPPRYYCQVTRS